MTKFNDPKITVEEALEYFGSKAKLAKELGLHRVTVTDWANKEEFIYIPPLHAYRLLNSHPDVFKKQPEESVN